MASAAAPLQPTPPPSSASLPDPPSTPQVAIRTGRDMRLACRTQALTTPTSGLAPGYLQANLLVLPSKYAADFLLLCERNPVPCPLLASSATRGSFSHLRSHIPHLTGAHIATDIDLRTDAPAYRLYRDGAPLPSPGGVVPSLVPYWDPTDHVAFLIGCSFSFEAALTAAGLAPRHTRQRRNVPMYRSNIPLAPAGIFACASTSTSTSDTTDTTDTTHATWVLSMRPYRRRDVPRVRAITRRFGLTHGEPVAWGWEAARRVGVVDVGTVDFGDPPLGESGRVDEGFGPGEGGEGVDEFVPVFWGCGVTPQEVVMKTPPGVLEGLVMAHAPGYMVGLDVREEEVFGREEGEGW